MEEKKFICGMYIEILLKIMVLFIKFLLIKGILFVVFRVKLYKIYIRVCLLYILEIINRRG